MNYCVSRLKVVSILGLVGLCVFTLGCGGGTETAGGTNTEEHSEEEHQFATVSEATQELAEQYAIIKTAFEAEKPEDAHDALHGITHVIEGLTHLADDDEEMTSEEKESLSNCVTTLIQAVGSLDGSLHDGEAVDFAEIDEKVSGAMDALKSL